MRIILIPHLSPLNPPLFLQVPQVSPFYNSPQVNLCGSFAETFTTNSSLRYQIYLNVSVIWGRVISFLFVLVTPSDIHGFP